MISSDRKASLLAEKFDLRAELMVQTGSFWSLGVLFGGNPETRPVRSESHFFWSHQRVFWLFGKTRGDKYRTLERTHGIREAPGSQGTHGTFFIVTSTEQHGDAWFNSHVSE